MKPNEPAVVAVSDEVQTNPLVLCRTVAKSIGAKANKNKFRARALTVITTASTAAIPVLIGLWRSNFVLGQAIPSGLAALTAVIVALGQIERPHERWRLYRRYQRLLEADEKKYVYRLEPFAGADRDSKLAEHVTSYELALQAEWEGLIPSSTELAALAK